MEKQKLDMMNDRLQICVLTAKTLKSQFPNELMKIREDTILPCMVKNKRKLGLRKKDNMGSYYAFYSNSRIGIKPKILIEKPPMLRTKVTNQSDRIHLHGNFALVELMCHELAHHRTKGHAKGFKQKYYKFLKCMSSLIVLSVSPKFDENDKAEARVELQRLKELMV